MGFKSKISTSCVSLALLSFNVSADTIPYGIQTNVSDAQIADWGFTECHRSGVGTNTFQATITSSCSGEYLVMGVWDESLGVYGVVGAGLYDTVTEFTYTYHTDDDSGTIQNWSNGLNWYRTSFGTGSWGFTTSAQTALFSADLNLQNGLNNTDEVGTNETSLAMGLSLSSFGVKLIDGYAYNTTGNDYTLLHYTDQRVFWTANPVPIPAAIWLFGSGLLGLIGVARRKVRA